MSYYDPHSKSRFPYNHTNNPRNRAKDVDTHELLKRELRQQGGAEGIAQSREYIQTVTIDEIGPQQVSSVPRPIEQEEGIEDIYLYCDSDAKISTADELANGLLRYDVITLNQNKPIDNIIEMQIGNFYIPEIATGASFPQYFFYKRVNILVEEVQAQSIFAQNSVRFHFEMDVQAAGIANLLTPASNEGKFIFSRPFRDIQNLSFRFRAPIKFVNFPQDVFSVNAVPGTSPARITTSVPHGLTVASNVTIFVRNFTSGVGNVDNTINSDDGFLITVIDATTLEFPAVGVAGFDFSGVITAVPGEITVGFRRIAFTIRFRSIKNKQTNRIVPV